MDDFKRDPGTWTVRDDGGVIHRALRQYQGSTMWVVTACPFWLTHNMSGQTVDVHMHGRAPTCITCVVYDLRKLEAPWCKYCGCDEASHAQSITHRFEAAT